MPSKDHPKAQPERPRRPPIPALALLFVLALTLADGAARIAAANQTGGGRPSPSGIILITVDTLRSDHLPAYGYDEVETPAVDQLARDGIVFEHAYAPVPLTLPSHASLLTGLYPPDHGVRDNLGYRLEETTRPYVPETLSRAGWATGAAVSAFVLRSETGLARGFDLFEDELTATAGQTAAQVQRGGEETLDAVLPWLRSLRSVRSDGSPDPPRSFFLWLHLYDPHTPYAPPEPFASRYANAYDGEIAAADRAVGRLLAELDGIGAYDESLIVFTSDHGEGLGEHGEAEHGILLHREMLQVPLILKLPGSARRGERVAETVSLVDVAPTFLEAAGEESESDLPGTSLLRSDSVPAGRPIYSESYYPRLRFGWSELLSVVSGRDHYIHGPQPQLFDLRDDPAETDDVLAARMETARRLRRALRPFETPLNQPFSEDSETREALLSLGYLGGRATPREGALPDPKTRIHTLADFAAGVEALSGGQAAEAVARLRKVVAENPQMLDAWQFLGLALQQTGRTDDAAQAMRRAFSLSNGSPQLAQPLAALLLATGEASDALQILRVAADERPDDPEVRGLEGRIQLELKQLPEALRAANQALTRRPDDPDLLFLRGEIHFAADRTAEAEADLRRVLSLAPEHSDAVNRLSVLLMATGRSDEALRLLEPGT